MREELVLTPPDLDDGTTEPADSATERAREALRRIAAQPYSEELRRRAQETARARHRRVGGQVSLL